MWAENLGGQQSISIAQVKSLLEARVLVVVDFSVSETGSWQRPWNSHDATLSDPMDRSLPGSSIHGIFQARVLESGATAFSVTHHKSL